MSKKHLFVAGIFLIFFIVLKAQVQQHPKVKAQNTNSLLQHSNPQTQTKGKDENKDSLVRLIQAASAQLIEIDSVSYRKVIGPATFLHNNTYLVCDTALWDVNNNIINAIGNVQIIQENTYLQGDKITYYVALSFAEVRGTIVKLYDKQGNILKTKYLDYNTKDSVGIFYNGGALKDAKGNIIESVNGTYYGKEKRFLFTDKVEVFTDSTFIVSDIINYYTIPDKVAFETRTVAWQQENMLSANAGYFDRPKNIFSLTKDGYVFSDEQEVWADSLKYNKLSGDSYLYNNVQILDTVQKTIFLSDLAIYKQKPSTYALLTDSPAVAMYSVEKGKADTLFMRGDTLKYYIKPMWQIDSTTIAQAYERKKLSDIDPIIDIDKKALEARTKKGTPQTPKGIKDPKNINKNKQEALKLEQNSINDSINISQKIIDSTKQNKDIIADSTKQSNKQVIDSLKQSTGQLKDTTSITFVEAYHNIKMYRSDLQAVCDSLIYTGIDSIARFYKDPIMWNDVRNQFTSDSMQVCLKNNALSKANFLSNAFIASQEDSIHFNQVKSTEMTAFFANNDLYRFDALGGASLIFYIREDSLVTALNQKECKLLTAKIKDREIQRIRYIESIKSDAKPIFNLTINDQRLRGFVWKDTLRPKSRLDITSRSVRPTKRASLKKYPFPTYYYTEMYFKEKKDSIDKYKYKLDSTILARKAQKELEAKLAQQKEENNKKDSILQKTKLDSIATLAPVSNGSTKDSLKQTLADSLTKILDNRTLTRKEKKAIKKELKLVRKQEKAIFKQQKKQAKLLAKQQKKEKKQQKKEQAALAKKQKKQIKQKIN